MKTIMSRNAALRLQQDMIVHAFKIFQRGQKRTE